MAKTRFNSATETVRLCKQLGWMAQNVERFNSFSKQRLDLFGCFDIVALDPLRYGTIYIQAACGSGDGLRHVRRMVEDSNLAPILEAVLNRGNHVEVWEWCVYLDKPRTRSSKTGKKFYYRDANRWEIILSGAGLLHRKLMSGNEYFNYLNGVVAV